MVKNYIRNMETGKIELRFSKEKYLSLSENDKKRIKSNFLFSRVRKAWVSRCKEPNLYWAIETARALGFTEEMQIGERLSFAEQMERKAQGAEVRAERYETYADNAIKRRKELQSDFNKFRGDIAFLTQPAISGHGGSQRFSRRRERIMKRYEKGFEEYEKSEYYQRRAETARSTARQDKMKNPSYLDNRIKECKKSIKQLNRNIGEIKQVLQDMENGIEVDDVYKRHSPERLLEETLDQIEAEIDKQAYFQNALDELGGIAYNQENIKVGYIVRISRAEYEVLKVNPKTLKVRCISGGAKGFVLSYSYSKIQEIIKAVEVKSKETETHPYHKGEILVSRPVGGNGIIKAYEIIKRTPKTIQIQEIQVQNGKPVPGTFVLGSKSQRKKPKVRSENEWSVSDGNGWLLKRWSGKQEG